MSAVLQPAHEVLIHKLRPDAKKVKFLGAGNVNDVVRVDSSEIFRFPKSKRGRDSLRYEATVLRELEGKLSLQIPKVKTLSKDADYAIFSYLSGRVLEDEEVAAFSKGEKQRLGKKLSQFVSEINNVISVQRVVELQSKFTPWREDEISYYATMLQSDKSARYYMAYSSYYEKFLQTYMHSGRLKEFALHDDLHVGNLLFDSKNELTGVVDFGDFCTGAVSSELRQIYRAGEDIAEITIEGLGAEFGKINLEAVRLEAILYELSVLLRPENQFPSENSRTRLAKQLLNQWLGQDWGEL